VIDHPLFVVLYHWLFIGLKGQTLGKMLFHIRVVNAHGGVPGLRRAALRELLGRLLFAISVLGFFLTLGSWRELVWHDKIAGTYLIKVR